MLLTQMRPIKASLSLMHICIHLLHLWLRTFCLPHLHSRRAFPCHTPFFVVHSRDTHTHGRDLPNHPRSAAKLILIEEHFAEESCILFLNTRGERLQIIAHKTSVRIPAHASIQDNEFLRAGHWAAQNNERSYMSPSLLPLCLILFLPL